MKGRMFVVNSASLIETKSTNIASIIMPKPTGGKWLQTVSDIMADMLQIEIGDYIFLWETSQGAQKSRIHGVYRAISKPFYRCNSANDNAPFKIHIEPAYTFANPIDEYDVLNCPYIKNSLWTIIGKKVKGKSRGTSPLSPDEVKILITLLLDKNQEFNFIPPSPDRYQQIQDPLRITYANKGRNVRPISRRALTPNNLNYLDENNKLYFEKTLETIFNQEMSGRNEEFFIQLGIDAQKVCWFSNYLPYSIEQSEMDYVIIESEDKIAYSKIYVIEFMKASIDEDHISRCCMYSKWVNDTLALGTNIVQPILICSDSYDFNTEMRDRRRIDRFNRIKNHIISEQTKYNVKPLKIYTYDFSGETPKFNKKN